MSATIETVLPNAEKLASLFTQKELDDKLKIVLQKIMKMQPDK